MPLGAHMTIAGGLDLTILRRRVLYGTLTILIILLSGCASFMTDFHFGTGCSSCHAGKAGIKLRNPENPSITCRSCHNYTVDQDHHPVTVPAPSAKRTADVNLPFRTFNGKMECLTCHQLHPATDSLTQNTGLLKGGPYNTRRDICFKRHKSDAYSEINPHIIMIDDKDEVDKRVCIFCHAEAPDPEIDRTDDVKFRASIYFLCWRCHECAKGPPFDNHFLEQSSFEIGKESGSFGQMRTKEEEKKLILPLDPAGRISCSTCHNPHEPGVMVDEKAKKGEGAKKRLRYRERCVICHER